MEGYSVAWHSKLRVSSVLLRRRPHRYVRKVGTMPASTERKWALDV